MIEPIRLAFEVACPPDHAFSIWTTGIDRWWPPDHTVTGSDDMLVVLEPRVGGRIFERTPGGIEHEWGEVTIWEPPARLGYLWHLRRDRADATEVEVRFVAAGEGTTQVEIEHRGWEVLGAEAETWRDRNRGGWATLLPCSWRRLRARAGRAVRNRTLSATTSVVRRTFDFGLRSRTPGSDGRSRMDAPLDSERFRTVGRAMSGR